MPWPALGGALRQGVSIGVDVDVVVVVVVDPGGDGDVEVAATLDAARETI